MPEAVNEDAPFALLERSELFAFLLDLIQRVYRPSIQSAVTDYGLVIVGGQSLTLWARQYLIDEMTGEDVGFVTSDDLDFIGKPNSIDYCAQMMGGMRPGITPCVTKPAATYAAATPQFHSPAASADA